MGLPEVETKTDQPLLENLLLVGAGDDLALHRMELNIISELGLVPLLVVLTLAFSILFFVCHAHHSSFVSPKARQMKIRLKLLGEE